MKIALGPLLYYWPRETVFKFYEDIADSAVDIVYIGETVCSRRHELRLADWMSVARSLRRAGKDVVLATQVLLESGSDVATMHKLASNGEFMVEANDMGAVHQLAGHAAFVAGPHLNIYNPETLQLFAEWGARRWVMPLEMKRYDLALMQATRPADVETEVFAYGRMPLAFSARCFTARHLNLPKDDCRFSCLQHPDGLMLKTRENEDFLVLNGIQTQSSRVYNLIDAARNMDALGVDVLRISPQAEHTKDIIAMFDAVRRNELDTEVALERMRALMPADGCNGYWYGRPGLDQCSGEGVSPAP